jgi:integrase
MARPATGQVEWRKGKDGIEAWHVRVTLSKNDRPWVAIPNVAREDEAGALVKGKQISDRMRARGAVRASAGLSASEWYRDYYAAAEKGHVGRKNRGRPQAAIDGRRSRFATWIEPLLGTLPMAAPREVVAERLRGLVKLLDEQVRIRAAFYRGERGRDDKTGRKPGLSAKSAAAVWGEVTSGFREACSSKIDALRVRTQGDDPTRGVLPPESADDREQAALFPSEVVKLLACELVPLARRRVYAVAIYTGMRRGELERLRAGDVDFDHDVIRVRGTKTIAAKRTIPIEPELRPLLLALVAEDEARKELERAEGTEPTEAPLLDVPRADGKGGAADITRADLERAEVTRADLTRDDDTHMPYTFHGHRHTCITHWAVAGRGELFLLTAGGHTDVEMTKRYLAQASSLSAKFGTPHPPIPASLLGENPPEVKAAKRHGAYPTPDDKKQKSQILAGSGSNSHGRFATPVGIEPTFPT